MKNLLFLSLIVLLGMACGNDKTTEAQNDLTAETTESVESNQAMEADNTNTTPKAKAAVNRVYRMGEVETMPILKADCGNSDSPWECTLKAVEKRINEYIEYPQAALDKGGESMEKVTIVVKADGSLGDKKYVTSKGFNCDGCQEAAVNAVAKLNEWKPAMKDGKPVDIELTIPVKFRIL